MTTLLSILTVTGFVKLNSSLKLPTPTSAILDRYITEARDCWIPNSDKPHPPISKINSFFPYPVSDSVRRGKYVSILNRDGRLVNLFGGEFDASLLARYRFTKVVDDPSLLLLTDSGTIMSATCSELNGKMKITNYTVLVESGVKLLSSHGDYYLSTDGRVQEIRGSIIPGHYTDLIDLEDGIALITKGNELVHLDWDGLISEPTPLPFTPRQIVVTPLHTSDLTLMHLLSSTGQVYEAVFYGISDYDGSLRDISESELPRCLAISEFESCKERLSYLTLDGREHEGNI